MKKIFGQLLCTTLGIVAPTLIIHAAPNDMASPESIVQKQLDAYNSRDIDAFLSFYSDDAELYTFPSALLAKGKDKLRERYTTRFSDSKLHAVIVKRIVQGNIVIDHERVQRMFPEGLGVLEAIAIYEVRDSKVTKVTFISGKTEIGGKL